MNTDRLKIVADENIPAIEQMFGKFSTIERVAGRTLSAEQVIDADVLLVRSVSTVNQALLENSSLRFVGSATIGTDHVDLPYLQQRGIPFASAPGCNADAVVEYDISCLEQLFSETGESLIDKTVAIIGVGNVGARLQQRLLKIGVKGLLLNDPLRAENEPGFLPLHQVMAEADIICMHTPLTKSGPWPSHHLVGENELNLLKPNAVLINAGRGAAIKGVDLKAFLRSRSDVRVVLDVWEHEPVVDSELAVLVKIATPHIAGYSLEGKVRGTYMLKQALCQQLGLPQEDCLEDYLCPAAFSSLTITEQAQILDIVRLVYDPYRDDRALRNTLGGKDQAKHFDLLRKEYPIRREFYSLHLDGALSVNKRHLLNNYGFSANL